MTFALVSKITTFWNNFLLKYFVAKINYIFKFCILRKKLCTLILYTVVDDSEIHDRSNKGQFKK
jgi:hypothetical protein